MGWPDTSFPLVWPLATFVTVATYQTSHPATTMTVLLLTLAEGVWVSMAQPFLAFKSPKSWKLIAATS